MIGVLICFRILFPFELEFMQVGIRPAHYNLDDVVQSVQPDIIRDYEPAPDCGRNILQRHLEMIAG
jgi:hypothetical protein